MSIQNDIGDDEFVPFLHNLGVETYKKSFEWMLQDPDFSGVLRWLYNNLDHNNALTAREEYRFLELEKKGRLLPQEELDSTIALIQDQYPGICLPGDKEGVEDLKQEIVMQKERLNMLEKHEIVVKGLVRQNEVVKEGLNVELTKLNALSHQYAEDETSSGEECLKLAEEVEVITESVVDVIAGTLDLYSNCHVDKEIAKKFITFGPLEAYRQSQALFRSHFDLYTSKKFGSKQNNSMTDEDLRAALFEAKNLEDRLTDALYAYVESKAELCGEQAKLDLVTNYTHVHPSQVSVLSMEIQTAVDLLVQEESILEQQMQVTIKDLVSSRTKLAVDTITRSALAVREQIHTDLAHLLDASQQALALDRLLYCALRHEQRTVEEFSIFASHLRQHVAGESDAVVARIDSMNEICSEHDACERKLQSTDFLLNTLSNILEHSVTDASVLAKLYSEFQKKTEDLYEDVKEGFRRKDEAVVTFKNSTRPLRGYIWDGCTKKPNCWQRSVAKLTHSLRQEIEAVEKRIVDTGGSFTSVKNGDKQHLRKLWQWFLTDEARLLAATKGFQTRNFS